MSLVVMSVDIYCDNSHGKHPYYRLWVDNELLTERTWVWPTYEIFIQENIEVDIEPGEHHIRIDNCGSKTNFDLKNLIVDGTPLQAVTSHQDLSFTI